MNLANVYLAHRWSKSHPLHWQPSVWPSVFYPEGPLWGSSDSEWHWRKAAHLCTRVYTTLNYSLHVTYAACPSDPNHAQSPESCNQIPHALSSSHVPWRVWHVCINHLLLCINPDTGILFNRGRKISFTVWRKHNLQNSHELNSLYAVNKNNCIRVALHDYSGGHHKYK